MEARAGAGPPSKETPPTESLATSAGGNGLNAVSAYHNAPLSLWRSKPRRNENTGEWERPVFSPKYGLRTTTLEAHFDYIRSDRGLRRETTHARAMLAEHGKDSNGPGEYKDAKTAGLTPTFGGFFKGSRKKEAVTTPSGYTFLDADDLPTPEAAAAERDRQFKHPAAALSYVTKSGIGTHTVVAVDPIPRDDYEYKIASAAARDALGVSVTTNDEATKDISRIAYPAHDPDARYREDVVPLAWTPPAELPAAAPKAVKSTATPVLSGLPTKLTDAELAEVFSIDSGIEAAFNHNLTVYPNKRDTTESGWDWQIAVVSAGKGYDPDLTARLIMSHRARCGAKGIDPSYIPRTITNGQDWVAKQKAAPAPGFVADDEALGTAPILDKRRRAALFREDSKLKDAIEHRLGGTMDDSSIGGWDRRIAERAFNAGATATEVVGVLKHHYDQHADAPDRDNTYFPETVKAVQDSMPVRSASITDTSMANQLLGVRDFKMLRVFDPESSAAPEFRFQTDGRAVHAGSPSMLLNQTAFRAAVLAVYKTLPKAVNKGDWGRVLSLLVEQAEDVTPGLRHYPSDHDALNELRDALGDYLNASWPELSLDPEDRDVEEVTKGLKGGDVLVEEFGQMALNSTYGRTPFKINGEVHIFLSHFVQWLDQKRKIKLSANEAAKELRTLHWRRVRPEIRGIRLPRVWRALRKGERQERSSR